MSNFIIYDDSCLYNNSWMQDPRYEHEYLGRPQHSKLINHTGEDILPNGSNKCPIKSSTARGIKNLANIVNS